MPKRKKKRRSDSLDLLRRQFGASKKAIPKALDYAKMTMESKSTAWSPLWGTIEWYDQRIAWFSAELRRCGVDVSVNYVDTLRGMLRTVQGLRRDLVELQPSVPVYRLSSYQKHGARHNASGKFEAWERK